MSQGKPQRTFLGHPVGLTVLFLTQMWERFSFFGMGGLLILYLTKFFRLPQESASSVNKWYTSIIYFTPLIGGYLADRFMGAKRAVMVGAALMAAGHFLMTFPSLNCLYAALVLLVSGCGLLTAPLTSQVGLLYAPHDPRRDSAYTIFYMGINLGATVSPLACGWLQENTRGGFHSGFALASLGMVIAFFTYLIGNRWIVVIDQTAPQPGDATTSASADHAPTTLTKTEAAVEATPSVLPHVNRLAPAVLLGLGLSLTLGAPLLTAVSLISLDTAIILEAVGVCFLLFSWVAGSVRAGLRDRVLAILLLGIFFVVFWTGVGQYYNAVTIWADQHTDRYLTSAADLTGVFPPEIDATDAPGEGAAGLWERWTNMFKTVAGKQPDKVQTWGEWWDGLWNPTATLWFQSINPLLIVVLAPLFALLWPWLERRGWNPSIPAKMGIGLALMGIAFALLALSGGSEAQVSRVPYAADQLPSPLTVNAQHQICKTADGGLSPIPYHAGRLYLDVDQHELRCVGVLPDLTRDDIVGETASPDFVAKLNELAKAARKDGKSHVRLERGPSDFDLRYAGYGGQKADPLVDYDPATRTLSTRIPLDDPEKKALQVAAGDATLRSALNELMIASRSHRISPWWLLGFFFLATLGELCCSPVGMSMVSQYAPARFSAMLMGLWLLTFSFGNFLAGALGEQWGVWPPIKYFSISMAMVMGTAVLLFALVRKLTALMHDR